MDANITIIIHTRNEANNIGACIDSARLLTHFVIVIDMESEDNTVALAKQKGILVLGFPSSRYVEPARLFGIQKADTDWVFVLDADERMTQTLADEIKKQIATDSFTYYKTPRKNIFAGKKWLKHGGWYPDHQIRLIKKSALVTWDKTIHAKPKIRGQAGVLKQSLIHYFHPSLENMVGKTANYEDIESDLLVGVGRQANVLIFFRKFAGELYRRLIRQAGFLDGSFGIIESIYQAFSKTITYLFIYEKNRGF